MYSEYLINLSPLISKSSLSLPLITSLFLISFRSSLKLLSGYRYCPELGVDTVSGLPGFIQSGRGFDFVLVPFD